MHHRCTANYCEVPGGDVAMFAGMKETTAGRHVGEVTGYTTGLWEDRDCANCIDRFDALVGTAVIGDKTR